MHRLERPGEGRETEHRRARVGWHDVACEGRRAHTRYMGRIIGTILGVILAIWLAVTVAGGIFAT